MEEIREKKFEARKGDLEKEYGRKAADKPALETGREEAWDLSGGGDDLSDGHT